MEPRFLRPIGVVVFLLAVQVWLTFWSVVGGDYHLQLMFWPWKFGLTVAVAGLIAAITVNLLRDDGISKRTVICAALLFAVIVTAGMVTYYYHMNEPADEDEGSQTQTTLTHLEPRL